MNGLTYPRKAMNTQSVNLNGQRVDLSTANARADALEAGEVDGICVGEPWNSVAVERGVGEIVLASAQIWRRGVEKVLTLREPVLEARLAVSVRAKVMGVASGQGFHGWIWRRRSGHFLPFAPVIT